MKQSEPNFSSMTLRKPEGIFKRPFSSTVAGACPIRTGSTIFGFSFRDSKPVSTTVIHLCPQKSTNRRKETPSGVTDGGGFKRNGSGSYILAISSKYFTKAAI